MALSMDGPRFLQGLTGWTERSEQSDWGIVQALVWEAGTRGTGTGKTLGIIMQVARMCMVARGDVQALDIRWNVREMRGENLWWGYSHA